MKNNESDNIFDLIEKITPFYNNYRDFVSEGKNGTEVLELMWDVGEILKIYLDNNKIKPHNLYWQIYGKAQGIKNSYITRDFLSYCLRIYKYFPDRDQIKILFPNLKRYSLFREAFPLLENPKYKLPKEEAAVLLKLLNSDLPPQEIKKQIVTIKSKVIGIKNDRMQKIHEIEPIVKDFVFIYNQVYSLIKENLVSKHEDFLSMMGRDYLDELTQAVSSLTEEGLYIPDLKARNDLPKPWDLFVNDVITLINGKVELRNRFRRVFPVKKIYILAEMLNALKSREGVQHYREKMNLV